MKILAIYLLCINICGFFLMGADKRRAVRHDWRVPEKMLFLCGLLGGALGSWLGMYVFHHKTRHWYFVLGMPGLCVLWTAGLLWIFLHFGDKLSIL